MIKRLLAIFLVLLAASATARGQAAMATTRPFSGITFTRETRVNPPLRLFWIQADLTNPAIHLRVCAGGEISSDAGADGWETSLAKVSHVAAREHLDVAVNGSFFSPRDALRMLGRKDPYFEGNAAKASGWTVSDGRLWSARPLAAAFPSLIVAADDRVTIARLLAAPRQAREVVSGCNLLVRDGHGVGPDDLPAPRCAAGLDAAGKTLTLLVVDGRRPDYSVGLSMKRTGEELCRLGCQMALCLDSGGSATMVVRDGNAWPVVNRPSDGHDLLFPISIERPVANALGIVVDSSR